LENLDIDGKIMIYVILKRKWACGLDSNGYNGGWTGHFNGPYISLQGKSEVSLCKAS
jgi:hypothetical protein